MVSIKSQLKYGNRLLKEFHRLDKEIANQCLTQDKDARAIIIDEIQYFKQEAKQYVNDTQEIVDSKGIHLKSRQHEYVNDHEIGSPALRDFYSYGITIQQVVDEIKALTEGCPADKRKYDGKFYYLVKEKIIYRNDIDMPIKTRQLKRTTLCEMVFKNRGEWVEATDIETERAEKYGGIQYEIEEPYEWIRKACNDLNEKTKEIFDIDYELFEKEDQKVRLNHKAK